MTVRIKLSALAILAALAVPLPALAQSVADGIALRMAGEYEQAHAILESLAREGNAEAQVELGTLYRIGDGVERYFVEAFRWYRTAAEQGYAGGQREVGFAYQFGEGVEKDLAEAARWLLLAAGQGDAEAQRTLGGMYRDGDGVAQDLDEAERWFSLAASQGDDLARRELAALTGAFDPAAPVCAALYDTISVSQSLAAGWVAQAAPAYDAASQIADSTSGHGVSDPQDQAWREQGPFWAFSNARHIDFAARRDTLRERAPSELAFDIEMSGISGGQRFVSPVSEEAGFGGDRVAINAPLPPRAETPPYGQWIAVCDEAHGFTPIFMFGVVDAAESAATLDHFWPESQQHPDIAGLTNFYRSSPDAAASTVEFLGARIILISATDEQQAWANTRALVTHGLATSQDFEDEQDQRAIRQMLYDAFVAANALLPENEALPSFLYNWLRPIDMPQ